MNVDSFVKENDARLAFSPACWSLLSRHFNRCLIFFYDAKKSHLPGSSEMLSKQGKRTFRWETQTFTSFNYVQFLVHSV